MINVWDSKNNLRREATSPKQGIVEFTVSSSFRKLVSSLFDGLKLQLNAYLAKLLMPCATNFVTRADETPSSMALCWKALVDSRRFAM